MQTHNLIYARVSTVDYQDYGRQVTDLENEILKSGQPKESIKIFAEKLSGYTKNQDRPALNEMLAFIKDNPNSKVWVSEISRLGRNPNQTRSTIDDLSERKIPIYIQSLKRATLDDDGKRDSIVNIILQVLMEFSHSEAEQMKARIKSGKAQAARDGKHSTNVFPYGYSKGENGVMVVEESEASIIRMIFDYYSKGKGIRAIATLLNDLKIPTKFNLIYDKDKVIGDMKKAGDYDWTIATVVGILKNPAYKGKKVHKGEEVKSPVIIDEELFDQCTDIRLNKKTRNYVTTYTYLLKDLMTCGRCGRNYYGRYKPNAKGDKTYGCSSKITSKSCGQSGVNIPFIETVLFTEIINDPTLWKYLSGTKDLKKQLEDAIAFAEQELKIAKQQLHGLERKANILLETRLNNDIDKDTFSIKNKELDAKRANVAQRIGVLSKDLSAKRKALASFDAEKLTKELLEKSVNNRTELRTIFQNFINKLIVIELGKKYFMIDMEIKIGDFLLPNTLKIFLDKGSVRFNPRYKMVHSLNPIYNDRNIMVSKENDILWKFENDFEHVEWRKILKEDFLEIN